MKNTLVLLVVALTASVQAFAGDIEWSGLYRIEGTSISNPYLKSGGGSNKSYGVQTLILKPKFVASDGLYIFSQFNILNSKPSQGGNNLGAVFGDGVGANNATPGTGTYNSSAISTNEKSEVLAVTEFYMKYVQEFGTLYAGRMPINFGLGMSYSSGEGLFDHYVDTRDMVAYKINAGNLWFMPMYGKVATGDFGSGDDVQELDLQIQYENPESDSSIGVFFQNRTASPAGNDSPQQAITTSAPLTTPTTQADTMNTKNFSVFYKKETENYKVGFELSQQSGNTGIDNSSGTNVKLSGFGAAVDYMYMPKENKWGFGVKGGFATGDDPKTDDQYEGFIFNRNYDVAMLLFNHPLGQADVLHTSLYGRNDAVGNQASAPNAGPLSPGSSADTEALSNTYYFAPSFKRRWNDHWSLVGSLTAAWLNNTTVAEGGPGATTFVDTSNALGYEFDFSVIYSISDKIQWRNEAAYLLPGKAWEVNGQFTSAAAYGLMSRAAVSF